MNLDRAREFYSAYYEGGLDDGLRQAFQRALAKDPKVADEYSQFVRIMDELKNLKSPIETPIHLHERIMARLDDANLARRATPSRSDLFFALRPLAYGTAATVAIIATIVSLTASRPADIATGGMFGTVEKPPTIVVSDGETLLQFASETKNSVSVTNIDGSKPVPEISLDGQTIDSPLRNAGKSATTVRISFGEKYGPMLVTIPGKDRTIKKTGSGSYADFLKAVSDQYAVTVVFSGSEPTASIDWDIYGINVLGSISEELGELGLRAESREGGLLWVTSN